MPFSDAHVPSVKVYLQPGEELVSVLVFSQVQAGAIILLEGAPKCSGHMKLLVAQCQVGKHILHLVEDVVYIILRGPNLRHRQQQLADGGLHEELLHDSVHVAGGASIFETHKAINRPAASVQAYGRRTWHGQWLLTS